MYTAFVLLSYYWTEDRLVFKTTP